MSGSPIQGPHSCQEGNAFTAKGCSWNSFQTASDVMVTFLDNLFKMHTVSFKVIYIYIQTLCATKPLGGDVRNASVCSQATQPGVSWHNKTNNKNIATMDSCIYQRVLSNFPLGLISACHDYISNLAGIKSYLVLIYI